MWNYKKLKFKEVLNHLEGEYIVVCNMVGGSASDLLKFRRSLMLRNIKCITVKSSYLKNIYEGEGIFEGKILLFIMSEVDMLKQMGWLWKQIDLSKDIYGLFLLKSGRVLSYSYLKQLNLDSGYIGIVACINNIVYKNIVNLFGIEKNILRSIKIIKEDGNIKSIN